MTFVLKFTDINSANGNIFHTYETQDHGWMDREHFLVSLAKYNGKPGVKFVKNGYQYERNDIGVLTKVEAV